MNIFLQFLADKNIEVIYSSPLNRAVDTAKIAGNNPNIDIIVDDRLLETTFGFCPQQESITDIATTETNFIIFIIPSIRNKQRKQILR